ncbi:13240_t:CDS:1, partial [Acaulospora colombiana]
MARARGSRSTNTALDQPSPSLIRDISTASDMSCPTPQRSADSPGSLFGSRRKGKKSPGKLYGGLLSPTSDINSFGRADVSLDSEPPSKIECLDGELVAIRASGAASPCEQARQRKASVTETQPEKKAAKEDIPVAEVRPRPRTVGHRRARTFHARPLSLYIPNDDKAEEERFPSHSRRYSSVNGFDSFAALHSSGPFSADSEESSMVLRRYYAFQREVEEALNQSRQQRRNTAFSDDELSS